MNKQDYVDLRQQWEDEGLTEEEIEERFSNIPDSTEFTGREY